MTDQQTQPTSKEAAPPEAEKAHPWAELGPEQFSLLRLAPLPIDRHTGPRPLRFIQMGRLERQSPRQSLLRLTLQLPGHHLRKEQNVLEVWADHSQKLLRFAPDNGLQAQGFVIESLDPLQLKARYGAPRVSTLHSDWNADKVQIVELLDAAGMLQQADQSLREQDIKLRQLNERIDHLRREDGSLRFTITCLIAFCLFQAGLLIWIATR